MKKIGFPGSLIIKLNDMPILETLDLLGLFWKKDPDFVPRADKNTCRVFVNVPSGYVFELVVTGTKFFDTKSEAGGGGAISLAKYLLDLDFVPAVKLLAGKLAEKDKQDKKKAVQTQPSRAE